MKLATHNSTHVDVPNQVFQHYFEAIFDVDTLDLAILNDMFPLFLLSINCLILCLHFLRLFIKSVSSVGCWVLVIRIQLKSHANTTNHTIQ